MAKSGVIQNFFLPREGTSLAAFCLGDMTRLRAVAIFYGLWCFDLARDSKASKSTVIGFS